MSPLINSIKLTFILFMEVILWHPCPRQCHCYKNRKNLRKFQKDWVKKYGIQTIKISYKSTLVNLIFTKEPLKYLIIFYHSKVLNAIARYSHYSSIKKFK